MELELKKLEDTIKSIHDEMFYLRERYTCCIKFIWTSISNINRKGIILALRLFAHWKYSV